MGGRWGVKRGGGGRGKGSRTNGQELCQVFCESNATTLKCFENLQLGDMYHVVQTGCRFYSWIKPPLGLSTSCQKFSRKLLK